MGYQRLLLMDTNSVSGGDVFADFSALGLAFHDLGVHTTALLASSATHFGVLRWLAVIAAVFLLIIERTNWRTNFLTALLVPYIVLNLPPILFNFLRGEVGKWIAFVAVVIRLFFPNLVRGTSKRDQLFLAMNYSVGWNSMLWQMLKKLSLITNFTWTNKQSNIDLHMANLDRVYLFICPYVIFDACQCEAYMTWSTMVIYLFDSFWYPT